MSGPKDRKLAQKNLKKLVRAKELVEDRSYQEAISVLNEMIASDSRNPDAFYERALAYLELGRKREALDDLTATIRIRGDYPGARDRRARLYDQIGDHNAAASDRLKFLRRNPSGPYEGMGVSPQDWADCAGSFFKAGNVGKARELLEEYFNGPVDDVSGYTVFATAPMRLLARILLDANEKEAALVLTEKAIEHPHKSPADQEMHAYVLLAFGKVEEADEIHRKLTTDLPAGVSYMEELGLAIKEARAD